MRRLLNGLYAAAAGLAGLFMIGTLLAILAGIVARLGNIDLQGTDAYAGYCMAAGAFLALAPTLRHGEHIRVTLLLGKLGARAGRGAEIACHAIAVLLSGALAFYACRLVLQSYRFHDVSQGMDATPLWIPQIGMATGAVIFFIAFVDDFAAWLRGAGPARQSAGSEPARVE